MNLKWGDMSTIGPSITTKVDDIFYPDTGQLYEVAFCENITPGFTSMF